MKTIPAAVLTPVVGLLSPYAPGLTETILVQALERLREQPAASPAEPLLSPRAACERGAFSRSTLFRLIKAGRLRVVRVGRRTVRIAPADLAAALTPVDSDAVEG